MKNLKEEWKTVPNCGGKYEISNLGTVRRLLVMGGHSRVIIPTKDNAGRLLVKIRHNWNLKVVPVKELMAKVFPKLNYINS